MSSLSEQFHLQLERLVCVHDQLQQELITAREQRAALQKHIGERERESSASWRAQPKSQLGQLASTSSFQDESKMVVSLDSWPLVPPDQPVPQGAVSQICSNREGWPPYLGGDPKSTQVAEAELVGNLGSDDQEEAEVAGPRPGQRTQPRVSVGPDPEPEPGGGGADDADWEGEEEDRAEVGQAGRTTVRWESNAGSFAGSKGLSSEVLSSVGCYSQVSAEDRRSTFITKDGITVNATERSFDAVMERFARLSADLDQPSEMTRIMTKVMHTKEMGSCCQPRLNLRFVQRFHNSTYFEATCNAVIILYVSFVILECDVVVRESFKQGTGWMAPQTMQAIDMAFFGFFGWEMAVRLLAEEMQFCFGKDWRWNVFDLSIVTISAIQLIGVQLAGNAKMWRSLRMVRMLRALRVIRATNMFRDLRVLIDSIFHVFMPLLWAVALLLLLLVLFSVIFGYAAASYVDYSGQAEPPEDATVTALVLYFSSVPEASLSLLMSLTGGDSWIYVARPLFKISGFYGIIYVLFILFMQLGVLNVVTSIFVAAATSYADMDMELMTLHEAERRTQIMRKLQVFFEAYDADGSGELSLDEFESFTRDAKVDAFFEKVLGVSTWKMTRFFKLLDVNGDGLLSKEEFVVGALQMCGQAKSVDLESLRHLCHMIRTELRAIGGEMVKLTRQNQRTTVTLSSAPSTQSRNATRIISSLPTSMLD